MSGTNWMQPAGANRAVVVKDAIWAAANRVMIEAKFPGAWVILALGSVPSIPLTGIVMLWHPTKPRDFTWVDESLLPRLPPGVPLRWQA